jgi:hypothetical protein
MGSEETQIFIPAPADGGVTDLPVCFSLDMPFQWHDPSPISFGPARLQPRRDEQSRRDNDI